MGAKIKIPDIGTNVDTVVLLKWLKNEGDAVKRGDALCEVETDKATSELESVAQGTLLQKLVDEGSEVTVGTVIAFVGKPGETMPE